MTSTSRRSPVSCRVGNSFVAGTLVVLADGSLAPIETLATGDLVLATDPVTGETSAQPVITPIVGAGDKHLVDVVTDAGTWTATANHPIWVDGKGWTDAIDVTAGDQLRGSTGGLFVVRAMHDRGWLSGHTVHNLSVAGTHTFYIATANGSLDALVHNCPGANPGSLNRHIRGTAEYAAESAAGRPRSYFASRAIAGRAAALAMARATPSVVRGGQRYVWNAGVTVGWSSTGQRLTRVTVQMGSRGWHAWPS